MRNSLINELTRLAENDSNLVLLIGDLGYSVVNEFSEKYPNRFFNTGIAEECMTSVAAGIALSGKTVFTYSIANFNSVRCVEQLRNDVCYHNANVKVISVGSGFSYGQLGMSHHSTEDIAMMRSLPGMRVYVPADPEEAVAALHDALSISGPCYIRLAKKGEPVLYEKSSQYDITRLQMIKSGHSVAILGCGPLLSEALLASDFLKKDGISAAVYSVPCIKPLDEDSIVRLSHEKQLIVSVEEHQIIGGLGGAIAEALSSLGTVHAPLLRLGLNDEFTSVVGSHDYLCEQYGLSAQRIAQRIKEALL